MKQKIFASGQKENFKGSGHSMYGKRKMTNTQIYLHELKQISLNSAIECEKVCTVITVTLRSRNSTVIHYLE